MPVKYTFEIKPPLNRFYYRQVIHQELNTIFNTTEFGSTSAQIDGLSNDGVNIKLLAVIVRDTANLTDQLIEKFVSEANKLDQPYTYTYVPGRTKTVSGMRAFLE